MKPFAYVCVGAAAMIAVQASAQYQSSAQLNSASNGDIARQLAVMKNDMDDMRVTLRRMEDRLIAIDAVIQATAPKPVSAEAIGCDRRLEELKMRLSDLKALGMKEEHPDVRAIKAEIGVVTSECANLQ